MIEPIRQEDQPSPRSRVMGCFLGGAVGDALGAPVEFMRLSEIRAILGPEGVTGYWSRSDLPGSITDDTQMTLFTAEGLIRSKARPTDRGPVDQMVVWAAYLRWLDTQGEAPRDLGPQHSERGFLVDVAELRRRRAPGNSCLSALRSGRLGTVNEPINDSKGCGGVMRVAPAGLIGIDAFELGCVLGATTHGHPSGYLAAGALAQIIADVRLGVLLEDAVDRALETVAQAQGGGEVRSALESALRLSRQGASSHNVGLLGEGWVAEEALAISVYCALVARNFRHGVLLAVNHSGDSDSTGSIAGQILGAIYGAGSIPSEWIERLAEREIVEGVAGDFADCFVDGTQPDMTIYPPN